MGTRKHKEFVELFCALRFPSFPEYFEDFYCRARKVVFKTNVEKVFTREAVARALLDPHKDMVLGTQSSAQKKLRWDTYMLQ